MSELAIDAGRAIIEPRRGKREEPLPPRAILAFTPQDVELIRHHAPQLRRSPRRLFLSNVFIGLYQETPLVLAGPMLGAPQTVLVLEKLIALGVSEVIALGWCGSLQTLVKIGDLVLPTGAFSEEGTSSHYPLAEPQPGPSGRLFRALKGALASYEAGVHEGFVWSTDAPYRETVEKVVRYREGGVLAVDMEISALFAVASYRKIEMAAALVVSDDLSTLKWIHGFREPRLQLGREAMIASAMQVVSLDRKGS